MVDSFSDSDGEAEDEPLVRRVKVRPEFKSTTFDCPRSDGGFNDGDPSVSGESSEEEREVDSESERERDLY